MAGGGKGAAATGGFGKGAGRRCKPRAGLSRATALGGPEKGMHRNGAEQVGGGAAQLRGPKFLSELCRFENLAEPPYILSHVSKLVYRFTWATKSPSA